MRLWARHASTPVHFDGAVRTAYDEGARVFLQVTGGNSLLTSVRRNLAGHDDVHVVAAAGVAPDDGHGFVRALARLAVLGAPVDPRALVPEEDRRLIDLPVARLDAQSYWVRAGRPAKQDAPAADLPPQPQPVPHQETPMDHPTNERTADPVNDAMSELLQLVQQQVSLLTHLGRALTAQPAADVGPPAPPAPAPAAEALSPTGGIDEVTDQVTDGVTDEVTDTVLARVARISAFPVSHLRDDQLLIDDLGFDSLMLTDLFTSLTRQWPRWTFDERAADRPTVGSIAAMIASAYAGTAPAAFPGQRAVHGGEAPCGAARRPAHGPVRARRLRHRHRHRPAPRGAHADRPLPGGHRPRRAHRRVRPDGAAQSVLPRPRGRHDGQDGHRRPGAALLLQLQLPGHGHAPPGERGRQGGDRTLRHLGVRQ